VERPHRGRLTGAGRADQEVDPSPRDGDAGEGGDLFVAEFVSQHVLARHVLDDVEVDHRRTPVLATGEESRLGGEDLLG